MKRALLLIVLLFITKCGLLACQRDFLKQRIEHARFIAVVDFGRLNTGADAMAERELTIRETLYGRHDATSLRLRHPWMPDSGCAIVIIDNETDPVFYLHDFFPGTKKLYPITSARELQIYKDRIREYIDILKEPNKQRKENATKDWLVRCATEQATRSEMYLDLLQHDETRHPIKFSRLQRERLSQVFWTLNTFQVENIGLCRFVAKKDQPRLKRHLLNKFYDCTDKDDAVALAEKILELYPGKKLQPFVDELRATDKAVSTEKHQLLIARFRKTFS